jgi:hypothetical protein
MVETLNSFVLLPVELFSANVYMVSGCHVNGEFFTGCAYLLFVLALLQYPAAPHNEAPRGVGEQ